MKKRNNKKKDFFTKSGLNWYATGKMMEKNAKEYSGSPILEPFHGMLILNPEMREKVMLICNSAKIQVSILILKKN